MSASWIQDRRRKQAAGYKDDVNASLSDVMGGLEASLAVPETERKRKLAEQTAADELGVKKSTAEASLLRAKTADEAAKESLLRKKTAEDAKTNESDAKKSESVLRSRVMAGDQYRSDVPTIDDPALGGLDDTSLEAVTREATTAKTAKETKDAEEKRKADAKIAADEALADARTADAEKKRRGGKAQSPDAALRSEKLRLEVNRLRNEAEGGAGSSVDKAATATNEKKKQAVLEVENFTSNIDRNIEAVKKMIDQTGTFELTGPEGAVMDRRLTEIATDLAKLADPGSVAREGEVALMRKGLVDSGWAGLGTSNKTAKAVLDALKSDVSQRRAEAYRVRGLDVPGAASPVVAGDVGAVPPAAKKSGDSEFDSLPD